MITKAKVGKLKGKERNSIQNSTRMVIILSYLDVHVLVEKDILGLEIAMHHPAPVAVVNGRDELGEDTCRLRLLHPAIGHQMVEDLPVWRVLGDQIDHRLRLHHLVQSRDVGMPQRFKDRYLAERLVQVLLVQTCFVYDLDGHLQNMSRENRNKILAKKYISFFDRLFVALLVCLAQVNERLRWSK